MGRAAGGRRGRDARDPRPVSRIDSRPVQHEAGIGIRQIVEVPAGPALDFVQKPTAHATEKQKDISDEQYIEFYKTVSHDFEAIRRNLDRLEVRLCSIEQFLGHMQGDLPFSHSVILPAFILVSMT